MAVTQVTSHPEISTEGKQRFPETTHDEQREPKINLSNPDLIRARVVNGKVIAPAAWHDDDEDEAIPSNGLSA